jgi:excinuclease UvrABC ATPase subunit
LPQAFPQASIIDHTLARGLRWSNTATWTGIIDPIRKAFAKPNSVAPALFLANSKGAGPGCSGLGVVFIDLAHLDPMVTA